MCWPLKGLFFCSKDLNCLLGASVLSDCLGSFRYSRFNCQATKASQLFGFPTGDCAPCCSELIGRSGCNGLKMSFTKDHDRHFCLKYSIGPVSRLVDVNSERFLPALLPFLITSTDGFWAFPAF
ncbi:hypothetical protein AVEN_95711-1 [Araneus ventricosus]|uniref:Secreted protein n=1 Tax=Araneus ventricosus TaxID=182803 RepID=A0A4Y2UNE1_ARAVE|nr:hypothetical protein AVEN_95711-1 [Araneus ventricosus]